jgi:DNA-binding XRE family transcriptional regulator
MWTVVEEKAAVKAIDALPPQAAEKYAFWLAIVRQSGPQGLRAIKGFHDEKLSGRMAHLRSSRLSLQWRVVQRPGVDRDGHCRAGHAAPLPTVKGARMASKAKKRSVIPARPRVTLTPGASIRIARELQEMTQAELAQASGIPQGTISSLEKGRVTLGAERAEKLARALRVHPAVLLWPNWEESEAKRVG